MKALPQTRSVAVIGGGIAAFAAAAAFRRALPDAEVWLFTGGKVKPEYVGAAAPYIHQFHRLVGIDPDAFHRRTGAVIVAEAEIHRPGARAFRLVPLSEVPHLEGAALHQLWLRRTMADPAAAPSWADTARRAQSPVDRMHGLGVRFNAEAYLALLRELAEHVGARISREMPGSAELSPAHDLVIDASDPSAADTGWLRVKGTPGSLLWDDGAPTRVRAVEMIEFAGEQLWWDAVAWRAAAQCEANGSSAGRVDSPWDRNVLAVGRAAVQCETFDGQPLAVALAGIIRALNLLPRPGSSDREAAEYNRRIGAVHDRLLDWAAERWGAFATPPKGLAALRSQFGHRGRIPFRDEDPVPAGQWIGWLLGSGLRPSHVDLTAMALPEARHAAIFAGA